MINKLAGTQSSHDQLMHLWTVLLPKMCVPAFNVFDVFYVA